MNVPPDDPAHEEASDDPYDNPYIVVANFTVAVVLGVAFSMWMIRYTDWFPVVGGLLALTGVFSWVAFLSNIVSDERKEQAQAFFDRYVLQRRRTTVVLVLAASAFLAGFTTTHGTLIVDTLGDVVSRTGELQSDAGFDARIAVTAGVRTTLLLPTSWSGQRRYRLKLRGLPAVIVEVNRWHRTTVIAPTDFWTAPVLLIRPTIAMSGEASQGEFQLVVEVDGKEWDSVSPYLGGSVWVGAQDDVEIPPARIDRWRAEYLLKEYNPALVQRWTIPVSLMRGLRPSVGARVVALVSRRDDTNAVQGRAEAMLRPSHSPAAFPQELVIDVLATNPNLR
jgi:hypothetical protein